MKSRLLPPPIIDALEFEGELPLPVEARRASDRLSDEVVVAEETPSVTAETVAAPVETPARTAPKVSARPKGRLVVAAILLFCVVSVSYFLWSTFLRDAAFGVVTGKVTALSPPWSGTLSAVYVFAGDTVRQGEVLAIVDDSELQASIDRLSDDLRAAQAELDAQAALIALAARRRGNEAEETRADYYDLRGELLAEQSRHDELSSKLARRQALAKRSAVSSEEIESLQFAQQGLAAKIENLQQAVAALEARLEALPSDNHDTAQLKPWLAKIENYQAEIYRLREKQRRGTLRAPVGGTIVDISGHVGERATPAQPLLELLPEGSLELVLYVKQNQADTYQIGQQAEVVVEPATETIVCQITRIGERFEKPESHVAGRYRPEEKLLPIYLTPTEDLPSGTTLKIGSIVRLPASLFGN